MGFAPEQVRSHSAKFPTMPLRWVSQPTHVEFPEAQRPHLGIVLYLHEPPRC